MFGYFRKLRQTSLNALDEIRYDPDEAEGAVRKVIDCPGLDGFQWKVWWVAGSGFFTTSYSIFAINVITPALAYIYPEESCGAINASLVISLTTLIGSIFGSLLFGRLADKYGRKSVYGIELVIVVVTSIGMTTASQGHNKVMNIYGWIGFWRFLMGIGLGADYPLSATIVAEWSSTRSRGRMMAAVLMMQSAGQLAVYAISLFILNWLSRGMNLAHNEQDHEVASTVIDAYWRIVVGIGAFPACVSLVLRRLIPETPSWLAAQGDVAAAAKAAAQVYAPHIPLHACSDRPSPGAPGAPGPSNPSGAPGAPSSESVPQLLQNHVSNHHYQGERAGATGEGSADEDPSWRRKVAIYFSEMGVYLRQHGRWRLLAGVMATWFLLDCVFYGLAFDNPKTISGLWLSSSSTPPLPKHECWRSDPAKDDLSIYEELKQDMIKNLITISTGTGSVILVLAIDYIPRVTWMTWMFVGTGGLFIINGSILFEVYKTEAYTFTVALYLFAHTMLNLGPNTIIFMLPTELFATKYRATFHGIAAASGKLGAILIELILAFWVRDGGREGLAGMLLGFGPIMLLAALVTWVWIPEVQYPRGSRPPSNQESESEDEGGNGQEKGFRQKFKLANKPLEEIANNPIEGQTIGFRKKLAKLLRSFVV